MANGIYKRERLAIAGQLKEEGVVTTAYGLVCEVYSCGSLIASIPMTVDAQQQAYTCEIDTTKVYGNVQIRFVASSQSGDKVVSNGFIDKVIND